MEMPMLLILILTAVTLTVGLCLVGFAVKAAKKETVWEQMEETAPRPTKREPPAEEWDREASPKEGLRVRAAAAGERNGAAGRLNI
jgi:hypothetical protein